MNRPVDNPAAFPQSLAQEGPFGGMTLHDWFAGQALAGLLASNAGHGAILQGAPDAIAVACMKYADAMLLVRKENSK